MAKICCGGFYLGEGLELNGRTLKATGSSSPVPAPEAADIGKVLGIVEDGAGAKYAPVVDGGLPDPSELADGTAAVVVNGEWKMQDGYGWIEEGNFTAITWDGNTEGRAFVTDDVTTPIMYKVSDALIQTEDIIGASAMTSIGSMVLSQDYVESFENAVIATYVFSGKAGEYQSEILGVGIYVPEDGTYFYNSDGMIVSSLTAPASVHQFDSALIPTSGVEEFVVKFEQGDDGVVADATWEDVTMAVNSGKLPKGIFYNEGKPYYEFQYAGGVFINMTLVANNTLMIMTIGSDGTSAWAFNVANYTLTPTT